MSSNGTSWTDVAASYANTNVCLKAFTSPSGGPAPGTLSITPANGLDSTGSVGGPFSPASQTYALTNSGGESIDWNASKSQSWTTLSSASGTLAPGTSTAVTVSINPGANSLSAGSYSDTVAFTNMTNGNGSAARSVSLKVNSTDPVLSVTPSTTLSASGPAGGPFSPSSQTYTLTNTGSGTMTWAASKAQAWTTLSATGGTLAPGASTTVTLSINSAATGLAAGNYADTITLANSTNGVGSTTRGVALTVTATTPGALSVTPLTGLTASGKAGGPFSPSSALYTLKNTGTSPINWTAGRTQTWVGLSATSGTLPGGASVLVTVSINSNANALAAGSYSDTISFRNTTNGSGTTTPPVGLTVTAAAPSGAYTVARATYSWIDPSAMTRLQVWDNSVSYAQTIPFTFTFYGITYSRVYIGSNGLMGFGTSGLYYYSNTNIPDGGWPSMAIYPYWDNLNPQTIGAVYCGTVGSAPNRKYVVSWVGVPHYSDSTAQFTFQAILCEGSNDIVFQYQNVAPSSLYYGGGRSATIGIENETSTQACKWSYNTGNAVTNGTALRFATQGISTDRGKAKPRTR